MGSKAKKRIRKLLIAAGVLAALVLLVVILGGILVAGLPRRVIREIERLYDVEARIGEAVFSWPATVVLRNLELRRRPGGEVILSVARLEARCSLRELLAARFRIELLLADGVVLSLRDADRELIKSKGAGGLPDYPIRVRNMDAELLPGGRVESRICVSGVALMLEPQASGCLAVEGGGTSSMFGRFRVSGTLGGDLLDSELGVVFSRVSLDADVCSVLPPPVEKLWREYLLSGEADLHASLSWPREQELAPANVELRWWLSVRGASFKLPGLSDPVSDVSAVVEGTGADTALRQVSGRYKAATFTCQGHLFPAGDAFGLRVAGQVRDMAPDPEVVQLLPGKARSAVDALRLESGRIDGDIELRLAAVAGEGGDVGLNVEFLRSDVVIREAAAKPVWFPYRLERITGALSVGLGEVVIRTPVIGWHGRGSVKVTGTLDLAGREGGSELFIEAADIPVDTDLEHAIAAVGGRIYREWKNCAPKDGTLGVLLTLQGRFDSEDGPWATVRLSADGCSATYPGIPYRLTGLSGQVYVRPDRVSFNKLSGWCGESPVQITGWFDTRTGHNDHSVEVLCSNMKLGEEMASMLGPDAQQQWRELQPTGVADLRVSLSAPTRKGEFFDVRVGVLLKNGSIRLPVGERRLLLTELAGRIDFFGDVCRFTGVTARCMGGVATGDGMLVSTGGMVKLRADWSGDNFSIRGLMSLLPRKTAAEVLPLRPSGQLRVRKCTIDMVRLPGGEPDIEYSCTVDLHDASLSVPMPAYGDAGEGDRLELSEISGTVQVENERGRVSVGTFALDKVRTLNGTLQNLAGKIRQTGPVLFFEDVRGELLGGQVEGELKVFTDLRFFSGNARASGVSVARLSRETGLTAERVWGDLRATLEISGERLDAEEGEDPTWRLSGSGTLDIDRANLGRTPLVDTILNYRAFLLDQDSTVEEASASFEINSRRLVFDKLVVSGPMLSTRGVGWMNHSKDMELDLYFYRRAKGSLLPNLPIVKLVGEAMNWAIDQIHGQLVVIHVTGTLRNPEVSPAVLKGLQDQVKRYIIIGVKEQEEEEAGWLLRRKARKGK